MNPDQDPNQQQYSIDYLNQIAPQSQKAPMGNRKFFLFVGGGLLIAVIVGILAFSGIGSGPTKQMQTLAARLQSLQTISEDAKKNIKSGQLRSINSNLAIFLTNTNRDIAEPLAKQGVDVGKLDKNIVANESLAELTEDLENARLNAVFDRTYAREMLYQLESLNALMSQIYTNTGSKSLKTSLEAINANLVPLVEQFEKFDSSS